MIDNLIGPHFLNGSYIILDLCSGIFGAITSCKQHLGLRIYANQHTFFVEAKMV